MMPKVNLKFTQPQQRRDIAQQPQPQYFSPREPFRSMQQTFVVQPGVSSQIEQKMTVFYPFGRIQENNNSFHHGNQLSTKSKENIYKDQQNLSLKRQVKQIRSQNLQLKQQLGKIKELLLNQQKNKSQFTKFHKVKSVGFLSKVFNSKNMKQTVKKNISKQTYNVKCCQECIEKIKAQPENQLQKTKEKFYIPKHQNHYKQTNLDEKIQRLKRDISELKKN